MRVKSYELRVISFLVILLLTSCFSHLRAEYIDAEYSYQEINGVQEISSLETNTLTSKNIKGFFRLPLAETVLWDADNDQTDIYVYGTSTCDIVNDGTCDEDCNTGISQVSGIHRRYAEQFVCPCSTASQQFNITTLKSPSTYPLDLSKKYIKIYIKSTATAEEISFFDLIFFSGSSWYNANLTNKMFKNVTGEWLPIYLNRDNFSANGTPAWNNITNIRLGFTCSAKNKNIAIDAIVAVDEYPYSLLILEYDDGSNSHYSFLKDVLDKYQFPANLAVVPHGEVYGVGATGKLTLTQAKDLAKRGWDLLSHTNTHVQDITGELSPGANKFIGDVSAGIQEKELLRARKYFEFNGLGNGNRVVVFPGNGGTLETSSSMLPILRKYYSVAVGSSVNQQPGIFNPEFPYWENYGIYYNNNGVDPTSAMEAFADKLNATPGIGIIGFHSLATSTCGASGQPLCFTTHNAIIDYIATLSNIKVITWSQLLDLFYPIMGVTPLKSILGVPTSFTVDAAITLDASDSPATVYVDGSGGSYTITLPTVTGNEGRLSYTFKRIDNTPANTVTISPNIEGSARTLVNQYDKVTVISNTENATYYLD
ncbi:MAG: polysaccharide deacetylase family protein [Nitrospirae bacterium]|nr:polysaccharide deacetylase family protein [Nitrospirota bacterium]